MEEVLVEIRFYPIFKIRKTQGFLGFILQQLILLGEIGQTELEALCLSIEHSSEWVDCIVLFLLLGL